MIKRVSIIRAFVLIIVAISVTCKSYAASPLDLTDWGQVQYNVDGQPDGVWVLSNGNTRAEQTINADPSILLGNFDITDRVIEGTWRVDDTLDNDFIGFVFGYQGRGQFYLFDWKQTAQNASPGGFAENGMSLKIVNIPSGEPTVSDFWATVGTANVSVIRHNTIPWQALTNYDFHLEFSNGFFVVEVSEGGTVLERWEVSDNTYTSGNFGFYNNSQANVVYEGFTEKICGYSVSPASQSFTASGGTGVVSITAGPDACDWTAVSNDPWITITSASTGIGNGSINYSVPEKLSAGSRTGTITIAGEIFTVTQEGTLLVPPCTFSITPTNQAFAFAGSTGSVAVTATPGSCDWSAVSSASWITVTSGSTGTGNGSVGYSISENTSVLPRTATITIAEQTFTVTQEGTPLSGIILDIKANGSDGPVTPGVNLAVTVSLDPGTSSGNVDWWVAADTPFGWFYFDLALGWVPIGDPSGILTTHQGPLFDLTPPVEILNFPVSGMSSGTYRFYFAIDTDMNGVLDLDKMVFDLVEVIVP